MQKSLKYITAEEMNMYIKYAEYFNVKGFCASTLNRSNIQIDKLLQPMNKAISKKKVTKK